MSHSRPILLAGVTVRMLAQLAVRAGYNVVALDYFGDSDLRATCPGRSLLRDEGLPYSAAALVEAAGALDAPAVVYTANLENFPAEVARLAQGRELLGNSPETLAQVRDPARLAAALHAGGFNFPKTFAAGFRPTLEPGRRWLWKPLAGGGGHGIRVWRGGLTPGEGVFQEYLPGLAGSAAFVANEHGAVLLGLTEQLIGHRAFGAGGFTYCGNLVPPRLPADELAALLQEVRSIISHLAATFRLRGLNGLDFIWQAGRAWTLEVNPRPSASLELLDLAYGLQVFGLHVRSFSGYLPDFDLAEALTHGPAAGKAIVYAPREVRVGDTGAWAGQDICDIPHPGEVIRQGNPVCTLLATADTPAACLRQLRRRAAELINRF